MRWGSESTENLEGGRMLFTLSSISSSYPATRESIQDKDSEHPGAKAPAT